MLSFFFLVGVEGKGLEKDISKDAGAQNEYRATESASQTGKGKATSTVFAVFTLIGDDGR